MGMIKFLLYSSLFVLLFLVIKSDLYEEVPSISSITCEEFLSASDEEVNLIIMWSDGYVSAERGNTTFQVDSFQDIDRELKAYCKNNEPVTIRTALDSFEQLKLFYKFDMLDTLTSEVDASKIYWLDGYISRLTDNFDSGEEWYNLLSDNILSFWAENPESTLHDFLYENLFTEEEQL